MKKVIVLNADMSILGMASVKRAIRLVVKERAEVIVDTDTKIHPNMFAPAVIRLIKAVRHLWKKSVPWSKQNVHTRDSYKCQYCGDVLAKKDLTIDHVIPKDLGGKNSWVNTVCCCFACNNKKGNKTPNQARMTLRKKPYQPTIMEFILNKAKLDGADSLLLELLAY